MTAERRFQINPEPLKLRGPVPKDDYYAGRCEAITKRGWRCMRDAVTDGLCKQHHDTRTLPTQASAEPNDVQGDSQ